MKALERVNHSVLGAWERPALKWMAARMPARILPDHLTALGVLGALLAAFGYLLSQNFRDCHPAPLFRKPQHPPSIVSVRGPA